MSLIGTPDGGYDPRESRSKGQRTERYVRRETAELRRTVGELTVPTRDRPCIHDIHRQRAGLATPVNTDEEPTQRSPYVQ
jgi:hypothetical protein